MYSLERNLVAGRKGEEVVLSYLVSLADVGTLQKLQDVTENQDYQFRDIDFIWEMQDQLVTAELKTDYRRHGYKQFGSTRLVVPDFAIGIKSNTRLDRLGWIYASEAERLLILDWRRGDLYDFHMTAVREFITPLESAYPRSREDGSEVVYIPKGELIRAVGACCINIREHYPKNLLHTLDS